MTACRITAAVALTILISQRAFADGGLSVLQPIPIPADPMKVAQQPAASDLTLPVPTPAPGSQPGDQPAIKDILNSTVTSPSTGSGDTLAPQSDQLGLPELPPETNDHNLNKTINLGPLHTGRLIQISTLRPIRLEASYTEPVGLKDVLVYALHNNLPIRINQRIFDTQRYSYYGTLGGFLPSVATNLSWTHSHVFPETEVNSRIFSESINFPVFQGGRVLYSAIAQKYRMNAARHQYATTINDTLLNTYNAYYNLLLQRALLQIRIKSVEVSEAQLRLNEQLYLAGTGTRFAVMQSRTQLALDRQALLQQQVAVRLAAIELSYDMNMPLSANLVPEESTVTEASLLDEALGINDLLNVTLTHRPELRQYEFLRLAAARQVQLAAAPLYPTAQWTITYSHTSTSVNGGNGGGGATGSSAGALNTASGANSVPISLISLANGPAVGVSSAGVPNVTGTALQMPQVSPGTGNLTVTPGSSNTTFGTATAATTTGTSGTVVTGGSGLQSGAFNQAGGFSGSSGGVSNLGAFGGKVTAVSMAFNLSWQLGNLGTTATANILAARATARQALLQANQVIQQVNQQVRTSYLNALQTREQIDVTAKAVASAAEELRLANLRVQMGVGTNLELIQAQRDYITALINQAQAIIASNQAQAQLLHDTGVISVDSLTSGYRRRIGNNADTL